MNITSSPNIKPFRDYDEHEVYNYFAASTVPLYKGTFVSLVSTNSGNTNVQYSGNRPATPFLGIINAQYGNSPTRVTNYRTEVKWKVAVCPSGTTPLGVALYDTRETNAYGENFLYRSAAEQAEQECAVSGQAIPILARGLVMLKGYSGTASPGTGVNFCITGQPVIGSYTHGSSYGRFLSYADYDGYALFKIEL